MTSSPLYPQSNGFIDNSSDSNESSRKSRSLGERPLSSTVDIPFHTYRQQPTIPCPTAEPQRLPPHSYQAVDGFNVLKPLLATVNNCRTNRTSRENSMIAHRHSNFENLHVYQDEEVVVFQPRTNTWTPAQVREEASKPRSYS